MRYNLSNSKEAKAAMSYLERLILKNRIVEIKKVDPRRSLNQNKYLHVLLASWGLQFGWKQHEAKQIYKELNKDIYEIKKQGRTILRSSAELNSAEMSKSIDVFRHHSQLMGYPLPLATNKEWIMQLQNEIERNAIYL
jgi:hypothetical protein